MARANGPVPFLSRMVHAVSCFKTAFHTDWGKQGLVSCHCMPKSAPFFDTSVFTSVGRIWMRECDTRDYSKRCGLCNLVICRRTRHGWSVIASEKPKSVYSNTSTIGGCGSLNSLLAKEVLAGAAQLRTSSA